MSEHAHHWHPPDPTPRPDSDPVDAPESDVIPPAQPRNLSLLAYVEREIAAQEADGRTMASWLDSLEPIPNWDGAWATNVIRELRDADDPRELD